MKFLLWLLFFRDVGGKDVEVQWPPHFPNAETPLARLLFLILAGALIGAVVWVYRKEPDYVDLRRKRVLSALRAVAALVLVFILTGAFIEVLHREESKGTLVVLVDTSQSMSIKDRHGDGPEAAALKQVVGGEITDLTRSEQVKRALANQQVAFLKNLSDKFRIETYTFGQTANLSAVEMGAFDAPGGALANLPAPADPATQLGAALRDTGRRLKGRKIDGVVMFTDGGWNRGEEPVLAAQDLGAPVFTVGVGVPQTKDIAVTFLFCEDVVFKGDTFPLTVRVRSNGYTGQTVRLVIRQDDDVVKEVPIEFDEQSEHTHTIEVTPKKAGTFTFSAEIEPFKDELSQDNNRRQKPGVTVVDKKIRVLLVEDKPRWESRFLKSILEGDKQRLDPSFIMREADERLLATDPRYKKEFPRTPADLRAYDVVILGNVSSEAFTKDELKNLADFVQKEGGGALFIAGRNQMPDSYAGTSVEGLLPVEFEPQPAFAVEDELARTQKLGFRPTLTADGKRSPLLRFAVEARENDNLWERSEPMFWFYPAKRLKPGATALAVMAGGRGGDKDGIPLIAQQRFGKGQVIWMGVDETWRWRYKPGPQQHRRFWGQLVNSLAMGHLLGKTNRVQLETDRSEYAVGDRVEIIARLLDKDFNKRVDENVTAVIERSGLDKDQVVLAAVKDQPGVFKGEYVPGREGEMRLTIKDEEEAAEHLFKAVIPRIEFDDPSMRVELLGQIANATSGQFVPLSGLAALGDALKERQHVMEPRREERTLWNAPGVMVLFALLLSIEWFLRKRSDLL
jgi:hypothetical protein